MALEVPHTIGLMPFGMLEHGEIVNRYDRRQVAGERNEVRLVVKIDALPAETPLWSVIVGLVVSISVGIFFGLYPAVKASRLDPIEALRYE